MVRMEPDQRSEQSKDRRTLKWSPHHAYPERRIEDPPQTAGRGRRLGGGAVTTAFESLLVDDDGSVHLLHPVRDPATFVFPDVHAFVIEHLVNLFAHPVRDGDATFKWCPRWSEHPGAHARLTALWQAWEALHDGTGTGPSMWWREHADPTMRALTHPLGPFSRCGPSQHIVPPALPTNHALSA